MDFSEHIAKAIDKAYDSSPQQFVSDADITQDDIDKLALRMNITFGDVGTLLQIGWYLQGLSMERKMQPTPVDQPDGTIE